MQATYTPEELKEELKGSNQSLRNLRNKQPPSGWREEFKEHPARTMARVEDLLEIVQSAIQQVGSNRELNELERLIFHASHAAKLHLKIARLPGIPQPKEDPQHAMKALAAQIEAMNL